MGTDKISSLAKSIYSASLDWLFPPRCASCGKLGEVWCSQCRNQVKLIHEPICQLCGSPSVHSECMNCASWDYQFDSARSWGQYSGTLRNAILRLKHRKNIPLGKVLARVMLEVLNAQLWDIDLVVPIPLAPHRLLERGYNQTELLAQAIAEGFTIRYSREILTRSHETVKQLELNAKERWENLLDAFSADEEQVAGDNVLVVDDIMTTGATLNAAATALKKAGADKVYAITLAKTLLDEEQG